MKFPAFGLLIIVIRYHGNIMNKRYQVFVSSTFADLQNERQRVIQTLMEMDCIPSGMELFPAMDEEQFEFIKRVIDDCDYYLLIVGGRYGSTGIDGISFTEKEYDYAISKDIRVLAFLHANPEKLALEKSEVEPAAKRRLAEFRERIKLNRLVKMWSTPEELPGLVALSLQKTIKIHPATGWVRANQIASTEMFTRLDEIQKENTLLRIRLENADGIAGVDPSELAQGQDELSLDYSYELETHGSSQKVTISDSFTTTWDQIFTFIAPALLDPVTDISFESLLNNFGRSQALIDAQKEHGESAKLLGFSLDKNQIRLIKLQFRLLGFVRQTADGWRLSEKGEMYLAKSGFIRRKTQNRASEVGPNA